MAKKLGQANIDRLDISDIPEILTSSNILTIKEMANILGKKNINKLTDDQVLSLTKTYEDLMVPVLLQHKRENLSDNNISNLLQYSTANNKNKIIDVVLQEKGKNLTPNQATMFIIYSPDKEKTCKDIIKNVGKDNLGADVITNCIFAASNKDDMAKILGPKNMAKMTSDHWERLIAHPNSDKLQVTKLMLQYTGANLSDEMIIQLLHNTKDKEMMAKIIIDNKGSNLTSPSVFHILSYVSNPEIFATMMGPENINKLTDNNIRNLLGPARDKIRMQKALASHRLFNKTHVAPPMAPQTMPQKTPSINVKQIPQKPPSINVKQKSKPLTKANNINWYRVAQENHKKP
jgi:hypothetical protein